MDGWREGGRDEWMDGWVCEWVYGLRGADLYHVLSVILGPYKASCGLSHAF